MTGMYEARRVLYHLGNPEPLFPKGPALGEHAEFGMTQSEFGTCKHGRQDNLTEALVAPLPVEERHGLPEAGDRPTIVALPLRGYAETLVCQPVQDRTSSSRGQREGALG